MRSGCSAFWVSAGSYQIKSKLLPTPCWVGWLSLRSRQHHALPQWHAPVLRSTQQQHALQAGQIADGRLGRGVGGGVVQPLHQLQVAARGNVRDGERAGAGVQRLRDTSFGAIKAAPHGAHALRAGKGGVDAQLAVGAGAGVGKACGAGHGQQFTVLHHSHIGPFGVTERHADEAGASGRGFHTPRCGQGMVFNAQALHV